MTTSMIQNYVIRRASDGWSITIGTRTLSQKWTSLAHAKRAAAVFAKTWPAEIILDNCAEPHANTL